MTSYTTHTRELGKITFSAPAATDRSEGYIWIEIDGNSDRKQVCYGGEIEHGYTMRATAQSLKSYSQKWLRSRRQMLRLEGL